MEESKQIKVNNIETSSELINIRTSDNISEIASGLVKFHAKIKNIEKSNTNPFYRSKYATLDSILEYIRPILSECGLSILQFPISAPNKAVSIKTILMSEGGQYIESDSFAIIPPKHESQQYGAAITYSRRQCVSSILSLSFDIDDDANAITSPQTTQQTSAPRTGGRI